MFLTLLRNGANKDRDFYLFGFDKGSEIEQQQLNAVEEFMDWVVITTYNEYVKRTTTSA